MTAFAGSDLWVRYGAVQAVSGVSLSVARGEIVGVLGPNGAGKSSLFRLLAGLSVPDRGAVHLGDVDVTAWPLWKRARAGLGYLPQQPSLLGALTVADNVAVAVDSVGGPSSRVKALLEEEGLSALAERPARFLSGGERRRVEITRCLALSPKVLLLDEPFAGVDPAHVDALRLRIGALAASGLAIILTDHQVHEALPLCTRAVVIEAGSVLRAGSPEVIAADPLVQERYLGLRFRLR